MVVATSFMDVNVLVLGSVVVSALITICGLEKQEGQAHAYPSSSFTFDVGIFMSSLRSGEPMTLCLRSCFCHKKI